MKSRYLSLVILLLSFSINITAQDLEQEYIDQWKAFYPSRALGNGMHSSIYNYEDFSLPKVEQWLNYNISLLAKLSDTKSSYVSTNNIDARLLKVQAQSEIDKWQRDVPHFNSLSLYASPINSALDQILNADFLIVPEKNQLLCDRLKSIQALSLAALANLKQVDKAEAERSLRGLERIEKYLTGGLQEKIKTEGLKPACSDFEKEASKAAEQIRFLINHVIDQLLPEATESSPIVGRVEYARLLHLYTDSDLTSEQLSKMALDEIQLVRKLIGEVSAEYLKEQYPNTPLPTDYHDLTRAALDDMEKDAPINAADYLQFWNELAEAAIQFIEEHKIATLPKNNTLLIKTAPESAGPAARIGWVSSAPPFDPNPITTLFLPSIPETLPKQEQIDFWASFNKPFNRMIVIHELLPGHYMQMKISRETAHPVRLLFPYGTFTEGWATFTERVLLDVGWEKENKLTLLAHLRKRIENANRAYTSVQVHTNGWTQEQVMEFSTNTSLVAPQFAKSLWGRLMSSPMQLTSYFLGGAQFTALLVAEKERLGSQFNLTLFMDTIMKAGPIPIEEFNNIFSQTIIK
ncbi:MAG: hypothetical protein ACI9Z3_000518 [Roseivirga sp.]|jgi:hypothetical protein